MTTMTKQMMTKASSGIFIQDKVSLNKNSPVVEILKSTYNLISAKYSAVNKIFTLLISDFTLATSLHLHFSHENLQTVLHEKKSKARLVFPVQNRCVNQLQLLQMTEEINKTIKKPTKKNPSEKNQTTCFNSSAAAEDVGPDSHMNQKKKKKKKSPNFRYTNSEEESFW